MDENIRFVQVLDTLKDMGEIASYSQVAPILGTNKAGISDIKNLRKKIPIELLICLKKSYPRVNIDYILTGEGEMLRSSDRLSTAVSISSSSEWIDYLREKDADLRAAREELDSLREKVSELEHLLMEKGTAAGGAPLADIAPAI